MQTHKIHVALGRRSAMEARDALYACSDVLDVFTTGDPDALIVVCAGRPRPAQWLRCLQLAGFDVTVRRLPRSAISTHG